MMLVTKSIFSTKGWQQSDFNWQTVALSLYLGVTKFKVAVNNCKPTWEVEMKSVISVGDVDDDDVCEYTWRVRLSSYL
jgi:hypothetical protein